MHQRPLELARLADLQLLGLGLLLHGLLGSCERGRDRLETHALARHESELPNFRRSPSLPVSFKFLGHAINRCRRSGPGLAERNATRAKGIVAYLSSAPTFSSRNCAARSPRQARRFRRGPLRNSMGVRLHAAQSARCTPCGARSRPCSARPRRRRERRSHCEGGSKRCAATTASSGRTADCASAARLDPPRSKRGWRRVA